MTFLTRILLDKEEALQLKLFDPYRWHQMLWTTFPDRQGTRDFLFRVDDRGREYLIYLLSHQAPAVPSWGQWEGKDVSPSFLSHPAYRFQLRANPVVRKRLPITERGGDKSGPLLPITDEAELRIWLCRYGEKNGFHVHAESLLISPPAAIRFMKQGVAGTVSQVDFSGTLSVTDSQCFANAFQTGIGRAKSFGFGLFLLSPCASKNSSL